MMKYMQTPWITLGILVSWIIYSVAVANLWLLLATIPGIVYVLFLVKIDTAINSSKLQDKKAAFIVAVGGVDLTVRVLILILNRLAEILMVLYGLYLAGSQFYGVAT